MYSVTQATQTPIAPTTHYQQTAHSALTAYQQLQKAKPVFTQIYQQPVSNLGQAAKAVDALNELQSADQVSTDDIKSAKAQVEKSLMVKIQLLLRKRHKSCQMLNKKFHRRLQQPLAQPHLMTKAPLVQRRVLVPASIT
jgi:hypothetical protein